VQSSRKGSTDFIHRAMTDGFWGKYNPFMRGARMDLGVIADVDPPDRSPVG